MSEFPGRSSVERDLTTRDRDREKSQSDERSIGHGQWGGGAAGGKVVVEKDAGSSTLSEFFVTHDLNSKGYQIRPKWGEKFSTEAVRSVIKTVLEDYFQGVDTRKEYDYEKANQWVEDISKQMSNKVRQLSYPRYKFVSHVVIGEHIGGGFHVGMKCLWDADSDHYSTYTYLGDNIFCVGTVCGIYCY